MIFDFLRKLIALIAPVPESKILLRPPGASEEFLTQCIRCGQCVEACEYHSIILDRAYNGKAFNIGTPHIDPLKTPCYLTMECVKVCPTGALKRVDKRSVRMATVSIDRGTCVAYQKIICKFCFKNCPLQGEAIVMDNLKPVIIQEKCTGCGVCYHVCPAKPKAIIIKPIN